MVLNAGQLVPGKCPVLNCIPARTKASLSSSVGWSVPVSLRLRPPWRARICWSTPVSLRLPPPPCDALTDGLVGACLTPPSSSPVRRSLPRCCVMVCFLRWRDDVFASPTSIVHTRQSSICLFDLHLIVGLSLRINVGAEQCSKEEVGSGIAARRGDVTGRIGAKAPGHARLCIAVAWV
jgi:hypothetical protein